MQRIKSIGELYQRENPETKVVEEAPAFGIELVNRIIEENMDKDVDLQFGLGPTDYERIFKKELEFGSKEEALTARNMLLEIKRLDELDEEYFVFYSPVTNTFVMANSDKTLYYYKFDNLIEYEHMVDVLRWITEMERHFI